MLGSRLEIEARDRRLDIDPLFFDRHNDLLRFGALQEGVDGLEKRLALVAREVLDLFDPPENTAVQLALAFGDSGFVQAEELVGLDSEDPSQYDDKRGVETKKTFSSPSRLPFRHSGVK
jgi:hypothetical protein